MHLTTYQHRKRTVCITIITLLLLAAVIAFICRGWIREPAMEAYMTAVYKPSLTAYVEKDFGAVNRQLTAFGVSFEPLSYNGCTTWGYQFISGTYDCRYGYGNTLVPVTDEFKARWQEDSPAFERSLLQNGWVKAGDEQQSIGELFVNGEHAEQGQTFRVDYSKAHPNKIHCDLAISYDPTALTDYPFTVNEECERTVETFGGY